MNHTNRNILIVFLSGFLLIMALSAYGVVSAIRQSANQAQQAIQPVGELTSNLATQVADILHPTPTILPNPETIIHQVVSLARLETIQYSIEKVITAQSGQGPFGFLFGDKLLLVAHGNVVAGVDLAKIGPQDLTLKSGVLHVRLPSAEVFSSALDSQKSYVYDRETGFLTRGNLQLESAAREAAEAAIRQAAEEDGILNQAQANAEGFLERFLHDLGYPEIIFIRSTPSS